MNNKVSVVMATYNGEQYLREQLNTILNQTYRFKELIVSDDGSTDNTLNIIREYQLKDNRIKLVVNSGNHGIKNNFLNGFCYASGDIIAPADQDDIWFPYKLECLIKTMTDDIDIVNAQDYIRYEDGSENEDVWYIPTIEETIWRNKLKGHTCIFKKELVSLFEYSGCNSWDYVLCFYACLTKRYVTLPDFTMIWRRHRDAVTFDAFHKKNENEGNVINDVLTKSPNKVKNTKSKWNDFCWVNRQLKKGWKHCSFGAYTQSRANLIHHIKTSFKCQITIFEKVLYFASKETIVSMFISGFYNLCGHLTTSSFKQLSLKNRFARLVWAFRTPYQEYYRVRDEKYLG